MPEPVFGSINLYIGADLLSLYCRRKASPHHNTATTLHIDPMRCLELVFCFSCQKDLFRSDFTCFGQTVNGNSFIALPLKPHLGDIQKLLVALNKLMPYSSAVFFFFIVKNCSPSVCQVTHSSFRQYFLKSQTACRKECVPYVFVLPSPAIPSTTVSHHSSGLLHGGTNLPFRSVIAHHAHPLFSAVCVQICNQMNDTVCFAVVEEMR